MGLAVFGVLGSELEEVPLLRALVQVVADAVELVLGPAAGHVGTVRFCAGQGPITQRGERRPASRYRARSICGSHRPVVGSAASADRPGSACRDWPAQSSGEAGRTAIWRGRRSGPGAGSGRALGGRWPALRGGGGRPAGQRCPLARAGLRRDAFITARPGEEAVSIMPDAQARQRLFGRQSGRFEGPGCDFRPGGGPVSRPG